MLTSILNIWSPDLGDQYALTQDLAAMAVDIEDRILNPPYLRARNNDLSSYTSTAHPIQAGTTGGENIVIDRLSILARNGAGPSTLNLNAQGGDLLIGAFSSTTTLRGRLNNTSLPWGFAAGEYVFASITGGTSRTATISLPSGRFTVAPRIQVSLASNFPAVSAVSFSSVSSTSFDVTYTYSGSGTFDAPRVHWTATQMTPTAASG